MRIKVRIQPFSAAVTCVESCDPQVILQGTVSNSLCLEFLFDHWCLDSHQVPGEEFWCQRWKLRIEQMQILDKRLNDRWQNAERAILRSDKCTWNKSENSLKLLLKGHLSYYRYSWFVLRKWIVLFYLWTLDQGKQCPQGQTVCDYANHAIG